MTLLKKALFTAENAEIAEKNLRKKIYLPLFLLLFATAVQGQPADTGQPAQPVQIMQPGQGCTVFYAAAGDLALAGTTKILMAR